MDLPGDLMIKSESWHFAVGKQVSNFLAAIYKSKKKFYFFHWLAICAFHTTNNNLYHLQYRDSQLL